MRLGHDIFQDGDQGWHVCLYIEGNLILRHNYKQARPRFTTPSSVNSMSQPYICRAPLDTIGLNRFTHSRRRILCTQWFIILDRFKLIQSRPGLVSEDIWCLNTAWIRQGYTMIEVNIKATKSGLIHFKAFKSRNNRRLCSKLIAKFIK